MIRNSFKGRCGCGMFVPQGKGYVLGRAIACVACAAERAPADNFLDPIDEEPDDFDDPIYGFD